MAEENPITPTPQEDNPQMVDNNLLSNMNTMQGSPTDVNPPIDIDELDVVEQLFTSNEAPVQSDNWVKPHIESERIASMIATPLNNIQLPGMGGPDIFAEEPKNNNIPNDQRLNDDVFGDIMSSVSRNKANKGFVENEITGPLEFGVKNTNYDRYYNHPKFQEIGFHPYVDNESIYNANSTWWDENKRMRQQFWKVAGTGFMSSWNAIGDFFSGNFSEPDMDASEAYEDAMRIGRSSKGGVGAFTNNLMLNSGYTIGILANIAVEELALAGLEAITFGGATPLVASRTAYNVARLGRAVDKSKDMANYTHKSADLLDHVSDVDKAKAFWGNGGRLANWSTNFFFGGMKNSMKRIKTLKDSGKSLSAIAKMSSHFAGFYRDVRRMNLAVAESKLEAGGVVSGTFHSLYNEFLDKHGRTPVGEELTEMHNKSQQAGFATFLLNMPIIYFSNAIVFDNMLRGFRPLAALMDASVKGVGRRIIKRSVVKEGQKAFVDVGEGRWKRFIKKGFSGNLKVFGGSLLRYTAPNSVEGIQEIMQEGIAVGAQDYYTNLYNDPAANGLDAQLASIRAGAASQWSGQGFEVFMSGFLMGGLVQGPQRLVTHYGSIAYQKITSPEEYKKYKEQKEKYIEETVKVLNEVYENPEEYFDPTRLAVLTQKMQNENMFSSSYSGDVMSFVDNQDGAIFSHLYTIMQAGKMNEFRSQMKDYLKLDEDGLAKAFPMLTPTEVKAGKARSRIESMLKRMDDIEQGWKDLNEKIKNPYDSKQYKKNTKEWVNEVIREQAFNHAKMMAMFTRETFKRALERSNSIMEKLTSDPIVAKMAANDIQSLADMQTLISEINLLKQELLNMVQTDESGKKIKLSEEDQTRYDKKEKRLKLLQNYFAVITDPVNMEVKPIAAKGGAPGPRGVKDDDDIRPQKLRGKNAQYASTNKMQENSKTKGKGLPVKSTTDTVEVDGKNYRFKQEEYEDGTIFYNVSEISSDDKGGMPIKSLTKAEFEALSKKYKKQVNKAASDKEKLSEEGNKSIQRVREEILSTGLNTSQEDKIIAAMFGEGGLNFFGDFDKSNKDKLKEVLNEYLQFIAEENKDFVNHDNIDNYMDLLLDYRALMGRANDYNKAIRTIVDPDSLYAIAEKVNVKLKASFEKNKTEVRSRMEKYVDQIEKSNFINELAKLGIYPDATQVEKFFKGEAGIPGYYETNEGELTEFTNAELNQRKDEIVETYRQLSNNKRKQQEKEEKKKEKDENDETFFDEDQNTDEFDFEETHFDQSTDEYVGTQIGDKYLVRQYRKYINGKTKGKVLTQSEWLQSPVSKRARKVVHAINRIVTEVYQKEVLLGNTKDITFEDWLTKVVDEENSSILDILKSVDITVNDILDKDSREKKIRKKNVSPIHKITEDKSESGIFIRKEKVKDKSTGNFNEVFSLVDSDNNLVEDKDNPYYQTEGDAKTARKKIVKQEAKVAKANEPFKFNGEWYKKGDILEDKDGNQYKVFSTPKMVNDNDNLYLKRIEKVTSNNKKDKLFWDAEEVNSKELKPAPEELNYTRRGGKIKLNEPVGTYPAYKSKEEIPEYQERTDEGVRRYYKVLKELTPEERERLTLRITRGEQWDAMQQVAIEDKKDFYEKKGEEKNPRIKRNAQEFSVEIQLDGETIAYFQGPTTVTLLDKKGAEMDPTAIERSDIINLFKLEGKSTKEAVEIVKNNYNKGYALYTKFRKALGSSEEVVVNAKELGVKFNISPGSMDIVKTTEENTSFEDLEYNSVEGVDQEDVRGDQKAWVVIDFSKTYNQVGKTKSAIVRTNIKRTSKSYKQILAKIDKLRETSIDPSEFLGKYVAFVTMPNGTSAFVQLSPAVMSVDDLNIILEDIKSQSKTTEEQNLHEVEGKMKSKKSTFNHKFNEELQGKYFIAAESGIYYELKLTKDGDLRIDYSNMNLKEGDKEKRDMAMIRKKDLQELNDFADLVKVMNDDLNIQQKISLNNFKEFIPKEISLEDVLGMSTPYKPGLIKDVDMTLDIDESVESMEVIKRTAEESKPKIKTKKSTSPEITTVDRRRIIKSGYKDVTPAYLLYLAEKKFANKPLSSFENRVYESNTQELIPYEMQVRTNNVPVNNMHEQKDENDASKLDELYTQKDERRKAIRKEARKNNPDVPGSKIRALYNEEYKKDAELNEILKQIKKIEDTARKIIKGYDGHEIIDVESFITWAKQNLPDSIRIEIDTLGENLKNGYMTVGMFMLRMKAIAKDITGLEGIIKVGTNSPFKYHEAFHAVFRMLLSEADIKRYLQIARKDARAALRKEGKTLKQALEEMRKQHSSYAKMPADILEERYYEEYMADEFEKFKMNPQSTDINSETKSLFQRIIDAIRWILSGFKKDLNSKKGGLQSLFRDIDAGRFKNSTIQSNRFTENQIDLTHGQDQIARKLIMGRKVVELKDVDDNIKTKLITDFMPSSYEHKLISIISNAYINRLRNAEVGTNTNDLLEQTIHDVIELYNPDRKFYTDRIEWYDENVDRLENFYDSIQNQYDDIKELVVNRIDEHHAYLNITDELTDEDYELAAEVGDWDKDTNMIGGISSLPKRIRSLISTTTLEEEDMFGNTVLSYDLLNKKVNEPIIINADPHRTYNGLLKVLANTKSDTEVLRKMWMFASNNPHTKAVVDRFFKETGLYEIATNGDLFNGSINISEYITDSNLYLSFMKGFRKFRVDYIMAVKDKKTKVTHLFAANKKDDAHHTVSQWAEDFNNKYRETKIQGSDAQKEALNALGDLRDILNYKKIDQDIIDEILEIRGTLHSTLGINLHTNYILYSLLSGLKTLTPEQKVLVNTYRNVDPIDVAGIEFIERSLEQGENLYIDNQVIEEVTEEGDVERQKVEGGVKYRLRKLAIDNAPFDESVGASTFIGPDGNRRYSHQDPTFHLVKIAEMEGNYIEEKVGENTFFESNMLLKDPKFIDMVAKGEVRPIRISGRKSVAGLAMGEDVLVEKTTDLGEEGNSYGSLTGKEFALSIIDSYTYFYNRTNPSKTPINDYVDEAGETQYYAMSPNLIRVIEATNTGDFVPLGIHKMLNIDKEGIHLTDEALDMFIEEIKREYERGLDYYENGVEDDYKGKERLGKLNTTYTLLTRLKTNRKGIKAELPGIGSAQQSAIANEEQSITLANVNNTVKTNVTQPNESGVVIIDEQQFVMVNKGKVDFSKLSAEEKTEMIEKYGTAITKEKVEDKNQHEVTLKRGKDEVKYYTYSWETAQFFRGKQILTVFEYQPLTEQSDIQIDLTEESLTREEVERRIDEALEEENYAKVQILRDVMERFGDKEAEEVVITPKEKKKDLSVVKQLEIDMKNGIPFDTAFKGVNGREVLEERLLQESNQLIYALKEIKAYNEISDEIMKGLGKMIKLENGQTRYDHNHEEADAAKEAYNLRQDDPDFNITQIFLNNYINTKSFNQLLLGDQAYTLKDFIDAIKRAKMQNAAGRSAATDIHDKDLGVHHAVKHISMFIFDDPQYQQSLGYLGKASKRKSKDGDLTDGQMYLTPKALRYMLFGFGDLTKDKADLLDKVVNGEIKDIESIVKQSGDPKKLDVIMNSMKLVYGDGQNYLKMSAITLTKNLTSVNVGGVWQAKQGWEELHNLREKLERWENELDENGQPKETLGIAVPASASKMMKKNVATTEEATDNSNIKTVTDLDANFMRLQLENPSNKTEIVDARQIKNLITSEQDPNATVILNGEEIKVKDLIKGYHKNQSDKTMNSWFATRNLIFSWDTATDKLRQLKNRNKFLTEAESERLETDLHSFIKFAIEGLKASKVKAQMMSYFRLDEMGEPMYNLNLPSTKKKLEELFFAYFSKGVLAAKQPGISAALVSDFGSGVIKRVEQVDENGTPIEWTVIRSEQWENLKRTYPGRFTAVDKKENLEDHHLVKGQFFVDRLRSNVMEYKNGKPTGQKYTEMMMPAHFASQLNMPDWNMPLPDSIAKMFGIRIPSQDKHSAVNLKLVDYLPIYYGSSAMYARELAELSGADFDIDKLYMQIKESYWNGKEHVEYGSAKTEEGKYVQYIRNVIKNAGKKGSQIGQALSKWNDRDSNLIEDKSLTAEEYYALTPEQRDEYHEELTKGAAKITIPILKMVAEYSEHKLSDNMLQKLYNKAEGLPEALDMLGLPVTEQDYKAFKKEHKREPYQAAIDNEILDQKFGLLGNKGMTDPRKDRPTSINSEPAVIEPLYDKIGREEYGEEGGVLGWLQDELGDVLEHINLKEDIDIDSLLGQLFAWTDNKTGAKSIGAVVLPNLIMSLLTENNVKIRTRPVDGVEQIDRLELNGNVYNNFGVHYALDPETGKEDPSQHRKQFIISALVTAMTDNAKEKLAARLGLKKAVLPTVVTMLGLGVDLKTTMLLVNFPSISEALFHGENKTMKTDKGFKALVKSRLAIVSAALTTDLKVSQEKNPGKGKQTNKPHILPDVNIETLIEGIRLVEFDRTNSYLSDGIPNLKEMESNKDNLSEEQLDRLLIEKAVLEQMVTVIDQTTYIGNMSALINLQKGLGRDTVAADRVREAQMDLGLFEKKEDFEESDAPIDARRIFLNRNNLHYTNNRLFNEFYDFLSPQVLLERTDPFLELYGKVLGNMTKNVFKMTPEQRGKVRNDMISYLLLKAYDKRLSEDSYSTKLRASLQNGLIYDHAVYPDVIDPRSLNIKTVVERIKQHLGDKDNEFINTFVKLTDATHEDNKAGITRLEANTWVQFTDSKLTEIQNSMLELFSDGKTYEDVMHLIHYLAVKDGMQFGRGSFLSVVPTEMTRDMMETIDDVHALFLEEGPIREEAYKNLFGMTFDEMVDSFVKGYLSANSNGFFLNEINTVEETTIIEFDPIEDMGSEPEVTIDYNQDESINNSKMLSNLAYRPFEYNWLGETYQFGSVMHAFQVLKNGKFDKRLDKKYRKGSEAEELRNVEGKNLKGNIKKTKDAYDEEFLLSQLIKTSILQNLNLSDGQYTLGMILIGPKDFIFPKAKSKESKTTKKALIEVRKNLVYTKAEEGTEGTLGETRKIKDISKIEQQNIQKQNMRTTSPAIISMDENGDAILTIDLFKGLPIQFEDAVKMLRKMGYRKDSKRKVDYKQKNKENRERVKEIAEELKNLGFKTGSKEYTGEKGKKFSQKYIEFPMLIRVKGQKGERPRTFILTKLMRDKGYTQETDIQSLIAKGDVTPIGNWAEYKEIKPTGTRTVNAIGFMWGPVPSTESIIEFGDKKKAGFDPNDQNTDEDQAVEQDAGSAFGFSNEVNPEENTTDETGETDETDEGSVFDSEIQETTNERKKMKEWFESLDERAIIRFNINFENKHPGHTDIYGDPWKISYENLQIELENSENTAEELIEVLKCYL